MRHLRRWPTLYKKSPTTGKIQTWTIWVEGSCIFTETTNGNSKPKGSKDPIKAGKNAGRANETTKEQQAEQEAASKYQKYLDKGYVTDESGTGGSTDKIVFPMLAHEYGKHGHKLTFPLYCDAKLDGCVAGSVVLTTSKGLKNIKSIVNSTEDLEVLSYNEKTGKKEFKKVVNRFDNGSSDSSEWMNVVFSKSHMVNCTSNHKFLTQRGWVRADSLDSGKDRILVSQDSRIKSLMLGTLLGDSSLSFDKRYSNVRFIFSHAKSNEKLFNFKRELFKAGGKIFSKRSGYGSEILASSQTITSSTFPYELLYEDKKRKECVSYLDLAKYFTWESLALWIADDGSLSYNNGDRKTPILYLHTEGYSKAQISEFSKMLKMKTQCEPQQNRNRKVKDGSGIFLKFSTKDTLYIMNHIKNLVIPGAEHKFYWNEGYLCPLTDSPKMEKFKIRKLKGGIIKKKYDIEVEGNHNYFANGILVHNCRALYQRGRFMSRGGKPLATLSALSKEVDAFLEGCGLVPDGELYNNEFRHEFEEIISAVKKVKGPNPKEHLVEYHVYDLVMPGVSYEERRAKLESLFSKYEGNLIKRVPSYKVHNESDIMAAHKINLSKGYEGSMIRDPNAPYTPNKRSYGLLKLKEFQDSEFKIVGIKEGRGSLSGAVGNFILEIDDDKGKRTFDCILAGKGRNEWLKKAFKDHSLWKGKWMQVKFMGYTNKEHKPRHPVGLKIRDPE